MGDETEILQFFKPSGLPYAFTIILATIVLTRLLERTTDRLSEVFGNRRLVIQQIGSLLRFLGYVTASVGVLASLFTLSDQLLLAVSGTVAVAAGFAMKDLAASVVAGLIILVDRPFQVGDRVSFGGEYGEVTNIGLRSVRINTLDDTQVTIPNNKFLTDSVASGNAGAVDMMVEVNLFVGVEHDLDRARALVREVVTTSRFVNLEKRWGVGVSQLAQPGYVCVRLSAKAYVLDARYEKAFQADVTLRALAVLKSEGITHPGAPEREPAF
jgi:small-conductance mechanosensitive channel